MSDICPRHSRSWLAYQNREALDKTLSPLPDSQAGRAGHTCSYCAYELGYKNGRKDEAADLKQRAIKQLTVWLDGEQ